MANQFVNLPVPAGNGVGASVDVSTFGASKSIIVGGNAQAQVTIEINNDAAQGGSWSALKTFQNTGELVVDVACRWMRVRVSNYNAYAGGAPNVDIGGDDAGTTLQALAATPGNGNGASVNTSALGIFKTVQVGGAFRGMVLVEVSEDGNDWGQPFAFQSQVPGFQSLVITAEFMRVKRVGVPKIDPGLPVVTVGACDEGGGGGGGLDVENEGVALAGNPYSTMNFAAGVKADDVGGTVARVRGATATAALTYRPGGVANDAETFTDWPTLYAKIVELRDATAGVSGFYQIVFEAEIVEGTPQLVVIPSDGLTYDMTDVEWIGMFGAADTSTQQIPVQVGDDDANPLSIIHLRKVTGIRLGTQQDTAISVNAELNGAGETLTLLDVTVFGDDGKFPITINGPSGKIVLDDNTVLSTSSITTGEAYDIDIVGVLKNEDTQTIQADALAGDGIVTIRLKEGSGRINMDQTGLTHPLEWLSATESPMKSLAWPFLPVYVTPIADEQGSLVVGYTNIIANNAEDIAGIQVDLPLAIDYQKGDFIAVKIVPGTDATVPVTITNGADTIDGAATFVINDNFESVLLVSNGVDQWFVLAVKIDAAGGPSPVPEKWIRNSPIAINLAADPLQTGLSQNFSTYRMIRAGSITGLGWRFLNPVAAGQITINIRINGGAPIALSGVSTSVSNPSSGSSSQAAGVAAFAAGDLVDVVITTNGVWAPVDNVLEVDLDAVFAAAA